MSIKFLSHYIALPVLLLVLLEASVASICLLFATGEWWALPGEPPGSAWGLHLIFAASLSVAIGAMGLYHVRMRLRLSGIALRLVLAALGTLGVMAILRIVFPSATYRVTDYALALALVVPADLALRYVMAIFAGEGLLRARVLIYGAGWQARLVSGLRRRSDRIGFRVVGYVPSESDRQITEGLNIVDVGDDLLVWCLANEVDEIVVAMDDRRRAFPVRDLLSCRMNGIEVIELVSFLERETGKVRLDVLNPSWMIFSGGFRRTGPRNAISRALDVALSLVLLGLTWPIALVVACAIKLEDGWNSTILYRQTRTGLDGKPFELLKFRSMREDAEADGIARWAGEADSRVTRVGAFIRKTRIDELPQLLNVLRGDMRFVGPRPERPEFVSSLGSVIPYYEERHCVKPGLTGWAQLCYPYGSSERDALEKLQYDLFYIKNRTLLFDLAILIQTVEVVLFGKGAR